MKIEARCDWCGKSFWREAAQIRGKNYTFCCCRCMYDFASKSKNPDGYTKLKSLRGVSEHMKRLNKEMNANRMTPEVRAKLRAARLGIGEGKTYEKTYGVHTHRVVAEQFIGRKLKEGEIVHHIDGNKRNNDPENLMIFKSQKEHAAYHMKLNRFFQGEVMPK